MKNLVILGAGTAGTMMSHHLRRKLDREQWQITIVDQNDRHYYQPGFLFIPFGIYEKKDVVKPIEQFIPTGVDYRQQAIETVDPDKNLVQLLNGEQLSYDLLIIATGVDIAPEEIEGMQGPHWQRDIFDFYTMEGALNLQKKLADWPGGHLVVHLAEMPIKCPVAPLEFTFLADAYFREKGMRDKVKLSYVTPLDGAFTKPVATAKLQHLLTEKDIDVVPNFAIMEVNASERKIIDYEGKDVTYDLLVTVPTNKGASYIERSGFGDELNFVPTHKNTLQSKVKENIFVIGDATDLPASKAGSVAHFEGEILLENVLRYIDGRPLKEDFDGHANCFVETGHGKALLIDFNYEQEPVPGNFPLPRLGPLRLLEESRVNHWGKLAFKWIYWNMLITGRRIPFVKAQMSLAGKEINPTNVQNQMT